MKIVSLIPLRGGSKGVPRKNIKEICGYPLCFYSINASINSKSINKTYISTDDDEIETVCNNYPVDIHRRNPKCGQDDSSFNSVIKDFLDKYKDVDIVVYIQATNPHVITEDIEIAVQKFLKGNYNLLIGVVDNHSFIWRKKNKNYIECINKKVRLRQKAIEEYVEDGSYYIFKSKDFIENGYNFPTDKIGFNINKFGIHQEIDSPLDFEIARLIKENKL